MLGARTQPLFERGWLLAALLVRPSRGKREERGERREEKRKIGYEER